MDDEQRALREGRITSSVVPDILGVGYDTPLETWGVIRGDVVKPDNPAMERGRFLEQALMDWTAHVLDHPVTERNKTVFVRQWAGDTVDGMCGDACVEGKTVAGGSSERWGEPGTDEIPFMVVAQCVWHMWARDSSRCWVPMLLGGFEFEFRMYKVDRSRELESKVVDRCKAWWDRHIDCGERPAPGAGDTGELLRQYPNHEPLTKVRPTTHIESCVRRYLDAHNKIKELDTEKTRQGNLLREELGSNEACFGEGYKVTWKKQGKSRVLRVTMRR